MRKHLTYRKEYEKGLILTVQVTEIGTMERGSWDEPGGWDVDEVRIDSATFRVFGREIDLCEGCTMADRMAWLITNRPEEWAMIDALLDDGPIAEVDEIPEREWDAA